MKAIIPVLLMLFATQSAFAQGRGTPEQMRERMTAQIEETITALELEGDRAETVRTILTSQADKRVEMMQAAMASGGQQAQAGSRREAMMAMRQQLGALEEETVQLLGEVLDEKELEKYAEIVASRQRGGRRGAQVQ